MYPYNPRRSSPRLKDYDYSQNGAYFITICTQGHLCLFGTISAGEMTLNSAGEMIAHWWEKLPTKFLGIDLDTVVVMPNHIHGIILIMEPDSIATVSRMVQWFKTMTTNAYIRGVRENHWASFERKLWQRSFHDHIIRDDKSYEMIRQYVIYNALNWKDDVLHPEHPQRRELLTRAELQTKSPDT